MEQERVFVCLLDLPGDFVLCDLKYFLPKECAFIDRNLAENDPTYKQIIPYCVIYYGDKILLYRRDKSSGESRLRSKYSIGVGGHINEGDQGETLWETIYNGCYRELHEELSLDRREDVILTPRYLLYDGRDEVGKVHLGIVFTAKLKKLYTMNDVAEMAWISKSSLESLLPTLPDMELWSRNIIPVLPEHP